MSSFIVYIFSPRVCIISSCFTRHPPSGGADGTHVGPITEPDGLVRREQYSLPPGFTWDTLDPTSLSVVGHLRRTTPIQPPYHVVHYISHSPTCTPTVNQNPWLEQRLPTWGSHPLWDPLICIRGSLQIDDFKEYLQYSIIRCFF